MQLAYLLVNIGGDNLAALTSLTHKQGSDLDCLLSDLTGVGGHNPKVRLLTEGAVVPLAAPLEPNRFWSALTIAGRRQLGPDKDVTQVFSSAEGDHGGGGACTPWHHHPCRSDTDVGGGSLWRWMGVSYQRGGRV